MALWLVSKMSRRRVRDERAIETPRVSVLPLGASCGVATSDIPLTINGDLTALSGDVAHEPADFLQLSFSYKIILRGSRDRRIKSPIWVV